MAICQHALVRALKLASAWRIVLGHGRQKEGSGVKSRALRNTLGGFCLALLLAFGQAPALAKIWESVPQETLDALSLERNSSPADLYEALSKRYYEDYNKGKYADFWEPIPMDQYFAPTLFYEPPSTLDMEVRRDQCIGCHTTITHGWVVSWEKSVHANLDEIRQLPTDDVRAYKKDIITEVETNLHLQGLLDPEEQLVNVHCADCHLGIGAESGNHATDLHLPDRATCGSCHIRQFAEAESEKDTAIWPQGQWPDGHPSHSMDYMANVELATWAAMPNREAAAGCTLCHTNQPKCDTCHTRHEFSTVEARKPEACSTCHNGVDHNEFEQYLLSKHGTGYQTLGDSWDWNARLADAQDLGGMTAPTCQFCHFEYQGEFTHNVVRKVRWGFLPTPDIADNLDDPWFEARKDDWEQTCSNCHSPRFARTYLDFIDTGVKQGTALVEETRAVVQKLYDDGLLVGQKTNRPAPPAPETEAPGAFYSLFINEGNGSTMVDRAFTEMWEQHVAQYMKGLAHVNPGGWSYSHGWSDLIKGQIFINEQDTKLREAAALEARVATLEGTRSTAPGELQPISRISAGLPGALALLGSGLLLSATLSLRRDRRRRRQ